MIEERVVEMIEEKEEMIDERGLELMEEVEVEMMKKVVLWMFWLSYFLSPFLFLALVFSSSDSANVSC